MGRVEQQNAVLLIADKDVSHHSLARLFGVPLGLALAPEDLIKKPGVTNALGKRQPM